MVLFIKHRHAFDGNDNSPDRYRTVSDIKNRPDPKVDKINNITECDPVDQIADSPSQDHRKGDDIETAEPFFIVPIIIDIVNQQDDRNDRDNDEDETLVLEQAKGNACVVDQGHMQNVPNDGEGFPQSQKVRKKDLGYTVKENNRSDSKQRKKDVILRSRGIFH